MNKINQHKEPRTIVWELNYDPTSNSVSYYTHGLGVNGSEEVESSDPINVLEGLKAESIPSVIKELVIERINEQDNDSCRGSKM